MARLRPRPALLQQATIPAPVGGVNTVDPAPAMPPLDAIYCYNLLAADYGLRSRLGFREWCTGITGAADNLVRSLLGFKGNTDADDRLFATSSSGIWDVTSSSASPPNDVAWPSTVSDAGYTNACAFATAAGRFLVACDEENGLYIYTSTSDAWAAGVSGVAETWAPLTTYTVDDQVVNGSNVYIVTTAGVSAASGGPTGTGTGIADGTVVWDYDAAATAALTATTIGPSLADQQAGLDGDPADFVFPVVFKNRLWFVERGTSRAWYMDTGALYGVCTSFDFGLRFKSGGHLVGLYNWSYDGGAGLDTHLVAISSAGDVVIYSGTDPASADTFGLKGTWSVGGVPRGRKVATDYGGELLVLSSLGVVPLSKLVLGAATEDEKLYATQKISNLFSRLMQSRKTFPGWGVHIHPTDNALMVLVPTSAAGEAAEPLVMAMARKAWSQYRDLPIYSGESWSGEFYFGTDDGRVCWSTDYIDNVQLSDPNDYSEIAWSVLTAYRNLGKMTLKRVSVIRPTVLSGGATPSVQATARYDFDFLEPDAPGVGGGSLSGEWDTGTWDSAIWGGEFSPYSPIQGGKGIGRDVAIAVRGSAKAKTTLVSIGVLFEEGGVL